MSVSLDEKEDRLFDEKMETEHELFKKLDALIQAKWDSDTLKLEIEKLHENHEQLESELFDIYEQKEDKQRTELSKRGFKEEEN